MNVYPKISVFVVISIMAFQAGCQQQPDIATKPEAAINVGKPTIEFESLVYDFGKVGQSQKMNGQFKFTNTGDAPLKITNVEKCCGAVTKLDKEELAPGESGVLHVIYTSGRMPGAMIKRLYINSTDTETPRAMLTIKAETVLKVKYEPRSLKLVLKEENAGCPKITLTSTDNEPFSITSFQATNDALTAEFDSSVEATQFVLEPKADIQKLEKTHTGRLIIGLAYPGADVLPETATIIFQALSRFSANPTNVIFLYDKPGEPLVKPLWIVNNYGEDFEVESTTSKEGMTKVLSQSKIGNRYKFSLEITPPSEVVRTFTDIFTIKLKGGETLEVACRGIYRAPKAQTSQ